MSKLLETKDEISILKERYKGLGERMEELIGITDLMLEKSTTELVDYKNFTQKHMFECQNLIPGGVVGSRQDGPAFMDVCGRRSDVVVTHRLRGKVEHCCVHCYNTLISERMIAQGDIGEHDWYPREQLNRGENVFTWFVRKVMIGVQKLKRKCRGWVKGLR